MRGRMRGHLFTKHSKAMRIEGFTPLSIEIAETDWSMISSAIADAWPEICVAASAIPNYLKKMRVVDRLCVYVCPDSGKFDIGWNGPRPFNGHIECIIFSQLGNTNGMSYPNRTMATLPSIRKHSSDEPRPFLIKP